MTNIPEQLNAHVVFKIMQLVPHGTVIHDDNGWTYKWDQPRTENQIICFHATDPDVTYAVFHAPYGPSANDEWFTC